MQACLRSSSPNAESEGGDLDLCGLGNFQCKYSLCKMSSLCYRSWFCSSTPIFCQGIVLFSGLDVGKKKDWCRWPSKLLSGPLSKLTWFEWETWISVSLYQSSSLPAKLFDFLCNGGKSTLSIPPVQNHWAQDSQGQCKTNLVFKIKCFLACRDHSNSYLCVSLIPYHHCPPFPRLTVFRTSNWSICTFCNLKVNIVPLKEGCISNSALLWWLVE